MKVNGNGGTRRECCRYSLAILMFLPSLYSMLGEGK